VLDSFDTEGNIPFCEAWMHAKRSWLTWFLLGFLLLNFGCRGTQSLSRFVQVRKDPTAMVPEIEPPRQRLATATPRAGSQAQIDAGTYGQSDANPQDSNVRVEVSAESGPISSGNPPLARVSSANISGEPADFRTHRPDASSNPNAAEAAAQVSQPATAHLSSLPSPIPDDRTPTIPQTRTSDKTIRSIASAPTKSESLANSNAEQSQLSSTDRTESPKNASQADLLQAFRDSPAEVQEQAMRQLVAALARTADKTTQPGALDQVLNNSLDELPELPAERNVPATVPPNRLALGGSKLDSPTRSEETNPRPIVADSQLDGRQSDADLAATDNSNQSAEPTVSNLEPAVVQAVNASKKATPTESSSEVLPVSASRDLSPGLATAGVVIAADTTDSNLDPRQFTDKALYDALLQRLSQTPPNETEAARSRRLIMARHLMVLAGDPDRAVAKIEEMSEKEQEYLRHQLLGLWTIIDPDGHPVPARRFTTALPQLREATKYLAAATDSLEVRSLAFCTEIESYGQIKTFPGNRFESGQQVILYCEIENFTVSDVDGGFETHLQGSYDIFNANHEKIVSQLLPADKQVSSNYLRDYFIAYQMYLPKQLEHGSYRLQLTMEDVSGKKYGQASIPLEIK
jgi:hypothetical protein